MSYEKTDAIVLRLYEFSETSLVAHLFTREFGRVSALAKGARRARARTIDYMDLLVHAEVVLMRRPTATLATLTDFAVKESYSRIRTDLRRLYAAYLLDELVSEVSHENERNDALYAAAISGLESFDRVPPSAITAALFSFEARFLSAAGFLPELKRCVHCGREPKGRAGWSPRRGGLLCADCLGQDPSHITADRGALLALSSLRSLRGEALDRVRLAPDMVQELRRLLDAFYLYVFERPLKTSRFLAGGSEVGAGATAQ